MRFFKTRYDIASIVIANIASNPAIAGVGAGVAADDGVVGAAVSPGVAAKGVIDGEEIGVESDNAKITV